MKPGVDKISWIQDAWFRPLVVLVVTVAVWLNAAMLLPWTRFSAPLMALVGVGLATAALQRRIDAVADYAFLVFVFLTVSWAYFLGIEADSILLFESIALLLGTVALLVMSIPDRRVLKAFAVFAVFTSGYMMAKYTELSLENSQTVQVLWFSLAALAGVLTKSVRERRLQSRLDYLERMVMRDPLTGLLNQQSAYKEIAGCFARSDSRGLSDALAVIDLDGFKEVNDTLGHDVGDAMLREVAQCIRQHAAGDGDVAARIGGDEFLIYWHGVGEADAQQRAEALRAQIRSLSLPNDGRGGVIDASIGTVLRQPQSLEPVAALVRIADQAMYAVKRGRAGVTA